MHNVGQPVATVCTDVMLGCDASIAAFAYDPERAKALLREAGYPNGFDFVISTTSGAYPGDRDVTLAIADQLNKIGVRARANVTEYGVQLKTVQARQLADDGWFTRFTDFFGVSTIIPFRAFYSPGEWSLWRPGNKEFDQLIEAANTAADEAQIRDISRKVQMMFKDEAPAIVPLHGGQRVWHASRSRLDAAGGPRSSHVRRRLEEALTSAPTRAGRPGARIAGPAPLAAGSC